MAHMFVLLTFLILSSAQLGARGRLTRKPLIPKFYPSPTNVTFEKGGLAVLYCSIENLGTKTVTWRKQPYNVPITVGEQQFIDLDRFYLHHVPDRDGWNLLIKNVQLFDAGTYECQISSGLRRNITLNVIEKGTSSRADIQMSGTRFVEKGSHIYLVCNATGTETPPEGIDWFKDGNLLTTKQRSDIKIDKQVSISTNTIVSSIRIENALMQDTGTYICRTSGLLTTRFKVDVLNAETFNVKRNRDFEELLHGPVLTDSLHSGCAHEHALPHLLTLCSVIFVVLKVNTR